MSDTKHTIGATAMEAILAGKTNEQVLEAVKAEFPDAKTSLSSINWYRNKLRRDGHDLPKVERVRKAKKAKDADAGAEAPEGDEF